MQLFRSLIGSSRPKAAEFHLELGEQVPPIPLDQQVPFPENWERVVSAVTPLTQPASCSADALLSALGTLGVEDLQHLREFLETELRGDAGRVFFAATLPFIATLALELQRAFPRGVPKVRQQQEMALYMSKRQAAVVLANGFFCTWPRRKGRDYNAINWAALYKHLDAPPEAAKLKMLLNYFTRIAEPAAQPPHGARPLLAFRRRVLLRQAAWDSCSLRVQKCVVSAAGAIEDSGRTLQMNFAHRYVGGGVLSGGCVQEEIRFAMMPELIALCLAFEILDDNEAVLVEGAERYNSYHGYGPSLSFAGDYRDATAADARGVLQSALVCVDALDYREFGNKKETQFEKMYVERELQKALAGWERLESEAEGELRPVASGNWGCGAYLGDREFRAVLQLVAASYVGRELRYYTFGDELFAKQLQEILDMLYQSGATVAQVHKLLIKYQSKHPKEPSFLAYLRAQFKLKI